MVTIAVKLQAGEPLSVPQATSVKEAFEQLLSGKQRRKTIAAYANDIVVDLGTKLTGDTTLVPVQTDSDKGLEILRHSTAHVMAHA
ncbi:MAG: threonine--tRNA ligase, partial [Deltaproteobacteria bacterium]|nr:threonine--tRNA ligase [Deltaproteobacteria bacterium]